MQRSVPADARERAILSAAMALQRRYDEEQRRRHFGQFTPRTWHSLPENLKAEFINITVNVVDGRELYRKQPIPTWVWNLVADEYTRYINKTA